MSDVREALARLLYEHEKTGRSCIGCRACPGVEFMNGHQHAEHVAELIAAEFLVVPRSEITGTEYGYRYREPKYSQRTQSTGRFRDEAIEVATYLRNEQIGKGLDVNAEALSRPLLPWTPIPWEEGPPDAG